MIGVADLTRIAAPTPQNVELLLKTIKIDAIID